MATYEALIRKVASKSRIEPELLAAHIMAESRFDPNAKYTDVDGVSSYGLMQLRIDTARRMLNAPTLTPTMLLVPETNIMAGAKYLQNSFKRWPNLKDTIASYNAGSPRKNSAGLYVNSKGVTNVQKYVDKVYGYYQEYKKGLPLKPLKSFQNMALSPLFLIIGLVGLGLIFMGRK